MTYQEMLDALVGMDEAERRQALRAHWQAAFSDGFVAYVQGQREAAQRMTTPGAGLSGVFDSLDGPLGNAVRQQASQYVRQLSAVWESMRWVYAALQRASERQGNAQGMVAHGRHRAMPHGVAVPTASGCFRCGAPASGGGLCADCLSTQQDWEQTELEDDWHRYDQQQADLNDQRLRDDQRYYDNQADFNDHSSGYTPDFSSDY
jgi:hypothetical protein